MGEGDGMKCGQHTPDQVLRKLREADRLLGQGRRRWLKTAGMDHRLRQRAPTPR